MTKKKQVEHTVGNEGARGTRQRETDNKNMRRIQGREGTPEEHG